MMNKKINKSKLIALSSFIIILLTVSGFIFSNNIKSKKPASLLIVPVLQKVESVNADTFQLAKYKGKVVILNFWASWSKSSRIDNKNLVRIYQKYKNNPKIVFVSVSLDTDESNWKTALEEDEILWKDQFCDFKKYESPMVKTYKLITIPSIILIDKTGSIYLSAAKVADIETAIDGLLK